MTSEERDLITRFIERVAGAQPSGQPLPPLDPEADKLLTDLYARYPEARYRITQLAMVQEHALVEAQNRINRLMWELQQMQQQQQAQPSQQQPSPWGAQPQQPQSRGFLSGLFGGGAGAASARPAAPQYAPPPQYTQPPQPQYPAGYNPGAFQQQGSGFLGSALRTAAGVAGGVVAADALMNLFGGHGGGMFGGGGWGGGPQTIVEEVPVASPWGAPPTAPADYPAGPVDAYPDPAQAEPASWQPDPGIDQGGWDQGTDDSGGWGGDDDTQSI